MKISCLAFCICMLTVLASPQQRVFHLQYRPGSPQTEVFSNEDLKQLYQQEGTLQGISTRLDLLNDEVKGVRSTLDHEILPTIHQVDFFKWLFALIIAAIVGSAVTQHFNRDKQHRKSA